MKISLISPYPDITSFGVRTISSFLKQNGHKVQLIFLPAPHDAKGLTPKYQSTILEMVAGLCADSDIAGISLMTNFFDRSVQITRALKKRLRIPVIWGGVHPTIRPDECIEYADIVCIGEAEDAFLDMLNKMEAKERFWEAKNFWFRQGGKIIKNELSPLPKTLDRYPFPDYSCHDHHVMMGQQMVPLTKDLIAPLLKGGTLSSSLGLTGYQTLTSRGCPYSCTYCINHTIKQMYGGKGKLRWRSVDHVIGELQWVKKNLPFVNFVWFSDDEFMTRKKEEIEYFCRLYKETINLPFSCLVSPMSITESKMQMMVDAGLIYVQMGVESASKRIQAYFKRSHISNEKMIKAVRILNRFKNRMHPPIYDFILDVPHETDADRIESLRFISNIPKPFRLQLFKLTLYPGTLLHQLAMEKGEITDERKEIYDHSYYTMYKKDYLNFLFVLAKGGKFPRFLLRAAIRPAVVSVLNAKAMAPVTGLVFGSTKAIYKAFKRVLP